MSASQWVADHVVLRAPSVDTQPWALVLPPARGDVRTLAIVADSASASAVDLAVLREQIAADGAHLAACKICRAFAMTPRVVIRHHGAHLGDRAQALAGTRDVAVPVAMGEWALEWPASDGDGSHGSHHAEPE